MVVYLISIRLWQLPSADCSSSLGIGTEVDCTFSSLHVRIYFLLLVRATRRSKLWVSGLAFGFRLHQILYPVSVSVEAVLAVPLHSRKPNWRSSRAGGSSDNVIPFNNQSTLSRACPLEQQPSQRYAINLGVYLLLLEPFECYTLGTTRKLLLALFLAEVVTKKVAGSS